MARWDAPTSFDEYVRGRHADLLRFAHVLCGDPHLAADLVQDALERTGLAWRRIERHDNPEGYVRRTIINCYLNRRRRFWREVLPGELPERPGSEQQPHDGELWRLLATLPRQQRAVIVLRYYEDMSEAQIAQTLGCSQGTVKSTASRAMAKLREALTPSGLEALR
ncbi:SigE family RNA polymerase sigma factor [Catellatospora tritici]|uniref:SigE family RNA polymerase sigma factor n=1 Tax=Catellatospora tritici TaxID=2851566 RepID=UPI001C2D5BAF|nr:SigE family RNA polymerase sigma factor [Catellatospora tritici]MBV1851793.1 SigE family RNA polymerase sigma factor [Catellatospora tritici]